MSRIDVSNDELHTVRDAMRRLNVMVDDLQNGERDKIVLTRHGKMVAVVVSVDAFSELNRRAEHFGARSAARP